MASPQTEKGFTKISNELLEAIYKYRCSGIKKDILFVIIRFTYGFHCKENIFAVRFISSAINYLPHKVSEALNDLIEANVIEVKREYRGRAPRKLSLNKNYESWLSSSSKGNDRGSSQKGNSDSSQIGNRIVPKKVIETITHTGTNKDNILNKTLNKNIKYTEEDLEWNSFVDNLDWEYILETQMDSEGNLNQECIDNMLLDYEQYKYSQHPDGYSLDLY